MTGIQKLWLEDLILEHMAAASNERLWAKCSDDPEAELHEQCAVEHVEFALLLSTLTEKTK